jgi:hypothetical protein
MSLFINNYELRDFKLEEHQFHVRDITLLFIRNNRVILPKRTVPRLYMCFYINKHYISLNLFVLVYRTDLLLQI